MNAKTRSRGFSLIEVSLSMALLALILAIAMGVILGANTAAATISVAAHLDQTGRRVFSQLRREFRQSGVELRPIPTDMFKLPTATSGLTNLVGNEIRFAMRMGVGAAPPADDWGDQLTVGNWISYKLEADGQLTQVQGGPIPRYKLVRERLDAAENPMVPVQKTTLCKDVTAFTITRVAGSKSVLLELTLSRRNVVSDPGGALPPPIQRVFVERIPLVNG